MKKIVSGILTLSMLMALLPLGGSVTARAESSPRTAVEAVAEMTWGANLVELYMTDAILKEKEKGYDYDYKDTIQADVYPAIWITSNYIWPNPELEYVEEAGEGKAKFKFSVQIPNYSDLGAPSWALFQIALGTQNAAYSGQQISFDLSDVKITRKDGTTAYMPSMSRTYSFTFKSDGTSCLACDEDGHYIWPSINYATEENGPENTLLTTGTEWDGATLSAVVTLDDSHYKLATKVDHYFQQDSIPFDQKELADIFLNEGANVIRLPVTWTYFVEDQTFKIDQEWLDAVAEEVNYILSKGAYCIINMHDDYLGRSYVAEKGSDGQWTNFQWTRDWMDSKYKPYVDARYQEVWRQIAEYFKEYPDKLIFEMANEPTMAFQGGYYSEDNIWVEQGQRVNEMNQLFVDTVRATGGNNATRLLSLSSVEYDQYKYLDRLTVPEDDPYLIMQIHSYAEMEGNLDENNDRPTNFDYQTETDKLFTAVDAFRAKHPNIPVIIGETGISYTTRYDNSEKAARVKYFFEKAVENGVPALWWEGYFTQTEGQSYPSSYWIYDKAKHDWGRPELLAAIKSAFENAPKKLSSVSLSQDTVTVAGGNVADITVLATAKDQTGGTYTDVVWSISDGDTGNVTIDAGTGQITVKAKAKAGEYTVTATPQAEGEARTATLRVARAAAKASSVTVTGGSASLDVPADGGDANTSAAFQTEVTDQFGDIYTGDVEWSITPNIDGVSIANGIVTVTNAAKAAIQNTAGQELTVQASCDGVNGSASIQVRRSEPVITAISLTRDGTDVEGTDTLVIPAEGSTDYTYTAKVLDQYGAEMADEEVSWSFTPSTQDGKVTFDGGKVTVTAGAMADGTFTLKAEAGGKSVELTVSLADIAIVWPTASVAGEPTYGQTWSEIVTLSGGSASLNGQDVPGSFTLKENGVYPAAGSQTYTVNFRSADGAYDIDKVFDPVTIAKKPVTVTVVPAEKVYGGKNPVFDFTVPAGALVGSDTKEGLGLTLTSEADTTSDVGSYAVTKQTQTSENYEVTVAQNTALAVTPKELTASLTGTAEKEYDGTTAYTGDGVTVELEGVINDDTVTAAPGALTFDSAAAGNNKTVTAAGVTLSGADAGNYTVGAGTLTVTGSITKATATAKDATMNVTNHLAKTYEFDLTALLPEIATPKVLGTVTYALGTVSITKDGYVEDSDVKVESTKLTVAVKDVVSDVEGEIGTVQVVIKSENYNDMTATVTISAVNKAVVTITGITKADAVYDGEAHAGYTGTPAAGEYTGELEIAYTGEKADGTQYSDTAAPVDAGTYTVTFTVPASDPEFTGSASVQFTVARKQLTWAGALTAYKQQGEHDETVVYGTPEVAGLVGQDRITVTGTGFTTSGFAEKTEPGEYEVEAVPQGGSWTFEPAVPANYLPPVGNPKVTATVNKVENVEIETEDGEDPLRLEVEAGLSQVPEGLAGKETLNTPEKITQALVEAAKSAGASGAEENSVTLDVTLQIQEGNAWKDVTDSDFPSEGITVSLPYPEGTGASYTFTVIHMLSSGTEAGKTEKLTVKKGADRISFVVTSLSPICIAWTAPAHAAPSAPTYIVGIPQAENGAVKADTLRAAANGKVTLTVTPDDGYVLDSLTVTDSTGKAVTVTDNGDGTYTFTMPQGGVTVEAAFKLKPCDGGEACPSRKFTDLDANAWYHEYTDYVITADLMRGIGGGLFDPDGTVERAQMVTVLWHMQGDPVVNFAMAYSDVAEDDWYAEAVRWAASEGIAGGYGDGMFGPTDPITREQMATMLYRYAKQYGGSGFDAGEPYELPFADAAKVSDWAVEASVWCSRKGILTGKEHNLLDPFGTAKRCEMAAILMRYCQKATTGEE